MLVRGNLTERKEKMKIRFDAPTEAFPFYSNVKVETRKGFVKIWAFPTDGREKHPALFSTKEAMINGAKRVAK